MKILLIVILLSLKLFGSACAQNSITPEGVALNFLVEKVLPKENPAIKKIYFQGKTDSLISSFNSTCFESDSLFSNRDTILLIISRINPTIENSFYIEKHYSTPKIIFNPQLKLIGKKAKKIKCKKDGYINVHNAIKIREYYYVELDLYSIDNSVISTIVEINNNNEIKNWCIN
jgi:hypothetical protein